MDGPTNVQMKVNKNLVKQSPNLSMSDLVFIQMHLDRAMASNVFFESEKEGVSLVSEKLARMISFVQTAIKEQKTDKNNMVQPPDNILFNEAILIKMFLERGYRLNFYKEEEKPGIDMIHGKLQLLLNNRVKKMNMT